MDKDTKELVKALVEGFSSSINKANFATRDDLRQVKEELRVEIRETMKEHTDKVLAVLEKYEALTEKHDRILGNIKDSFDKEK